jgi:hypothetical protein
VLIRDALAGELRRRAAEAQRFHNPYLIGGVKRTPLRPGDGARVREARQLIVLRDREPPTRLRRWMDAPAVVAEPLEPTAPEELARRSGGSPAGSRGGCRRPRSRR